MQPYTGVTIPAAYPGHPPMKQLIREIENLLPLVQKPAQYAGGERGAVLKKLSEVELHIALVFPDLYEIGMSHLGLKVLYYILNSIPGVAAERVYAPMPDMEKQLRSQDLPLFSIESRIPLYEFDIVGITLQTELNYSTILNILDLGGINVRREERTETGPVVLGGGPCAVNPEPLSDFFDLFLVGDGEEAVAEIAEAALEIRKRIPRGRGRRALIEAVSRVEGVYSPVQPSPVVRRWVREMRREWMPAEPLVPLTEVVQDRLALEIQRGCTRGCRFCQAGYTNRPVRELPPDDVLNLVNSGLACSGWQELGLVSLSTSDYSSISELNLKLASLPSMAHVSTSYPSLRADSFSIDLAAGASRVRRTGLTFAPEAGSIELRKKLNKPIPDDKLISVLKYAFTRGWRKVKLYFMIGLPDETPADTERMVDFIYRLSRMARALKSGGKITVSIGIYVPKPHTPLQWEAFAGLENIERKLDYLKRHLTFRNVKLKWQEPFPAFVEAYFSRGDRSTGAVLYDAWSRGAGLDSWSSYFNRDAWSDAFAGAGIDIRSPLPGEDPDDPLPWDIIDIGVEKRFLRSELDNFRNGEFTPDCREGVCTGCGLVDCPMADAAVQIRAPGKPAVSDDRETVEPAVMGEEQSVGAQEREGAAPASGSHVDSPSVTKRKADQTHPKPGHPSGNGWGRRKKPVTHRERFGLRFRVKYSRTGAARYLSHLDLTRCWTRMLRMSDLPIAYSTGFTPRPKVEYGPPAPVGIASRTELIDFDLEKPPSVDIATALNKVAVPGVSVVYVRRRDPRESSLSASINSALYDVSIPVTLISGTHRLDESIKNFHSRTEFLHTFSRGLKTKTVDMTRAILSLELDTPKRDHEVAGSFHGNETRALLKMLLRIGDQQGNNTNPATVLRLVFGFSPEEAAAAEIERISFFDKWDCEVGG